MKRIFLSDSSNIENDSFKVHTKISETLHEIIEKHEVEKESFTIGLFGEWGSGKSFIVNKLNNIISNDVNKNITFFYIDVWKYSGFPLLRSILFDLNNQLIDLSKKDKKYKCFSNGFKNNNGKGLEEILYCDEVFESQSELNFSEYLKSLKALLKRYKRPFILTMILFLTFALYQFLPDDLLKSNLLIKLKDVLKAFFPFFAFIGGIGIFLPLLQKPLQELGELVFFRNTIRNFTEKANFSPEQFEKLFRELLKKINDEKFVIIFDNIDRCEPSLAYETLSSIKTFMDVHNCFYIIPCDDDAIKNFLSKGNETNNSFERKFAEEFIDKIFQTYIRIPYLKEIERDTYIKEQLEQIDFENEFSQEEIEVITEILYFAYRGESPRNIKRFLNDYSTYFRFANHAHPSLLNNIVLFSVIIAIKQKWYTFEKVLIENPTFFKDFINDKAKIDEFKNDISEFEGLKVFLHNIKFYIQSFSNTSVGEFIHFKKSEQTIEIVENLRSSKNIQTEINGENLKILRKEFQKNSQSNTAFTLNSFISWASLISNNEESRFFRIIISDFWKNLSESEIDYSKLFLILNQEELLLNIINTLNNKAVFHIKSVVEKNICEIFLVPLKPDSNTEETTQYQELFNKMICSEYEFNKNNIHKIFNSWNLGNTYLTELLKHIDSSKKVKYLPSSVLRELNNNITAQTIEIYNYWGHTNIPVYFGKQLFSKLIERITSRNPTIGNHQQLTQQWANIELDSKLMYLMNTSFMAKENVINFIGALNSLMQKIFQFSNNNNTYINKGVDFWIEAIYSSTIAPEEYDTILTKHFTSNLQPQKRIDYLIENINYEDSILKLPKLKSEIYDKSEKLQIKILSYLDEEFHEDYDLMFCLPIRMKDIQIIKSAIIDKSTSKDSEKSFVKYILSTVIKDNSETPPSVVEKFTKVTELMSFEGNKSILKDNRNRFIDLYKQDPSIGVDLFSLLKNQLTPNDFKKLFIAPIIRFINSEIESTKTVGQYENISNFIELEKDDDTIIDNSVRIIEGCLANNQEVIENYFGVNLFLKIFNSLNETIRAKISDLINSNDNLSSWDSGIIEKLLKQNIKISTNKEDGLED